MTIKKIAAIASSVCILSISASAQAASKTDATMQDPSQSMAKMQKDFKMNKKDFVNQVAKSFDDMDKNHDGFLTMDELSGGKSGMMQPPAVPVPAPTPAPTVAQQPSSPSSTDTTSPKSIAPVTGIAPIGR